VNEVRNLLHWEKGSFMRETRTAAISALVLLLAASAIGLAGCGSSGSMPAASSPAKPATAMTASSQSSASADMADMGCGLCAAKGNVPTVSGTVKVVDGVQVAEIGIKDNVYTPNTFTAKSGMPIKVVFTGEASKCLAKPTFSKLNKSVSIAQSGSGTIELGTLAAGTYELTCGMGSHGGNIIVE
jgi:plastocyanin domain-containing protein